MQSKNFIPAVTLPDGEKIKGSGWQITEPKQPALQVRDGEVFINETFIGPDKEFAAGMTIGINKNISATITMDNLTLREKLSGVISPYMAGEATEFTDELVGEVMALFEKEDARKLIDRCIEEAIKKNCCPGGVIYNAIRR